MLPALLKSWSRNWLCQNHQCTHFNYATVEANMIISLMAFKDQHHNFTKCHSMSNCQIKTFNSLLKMHSCVSFESQISGHSVENLEHSTFQWHPQFTSKPSWKDFFSICTSQTHTAEISMHYIILCDASQRHTTSGEAVIILKCADRKCCGCEGIGRKGRTETRPEPKQQ